MLSRLTAAAASIAAFALVGCSSSHVPPSPVPAPLTDFQAVQLGNAYLAQHQVPNAWLHSALRDCNGYLLAYTTVFDPDGKPPKQSHLVIVRDDGTVREVHFNADQ